MRALYEAMLIASFCSDIGKELNKQFAPSNGNPDGITRNVLIGGFRRGNALAGLVALGHEKAKVEMLLRKFTKESTRRVARTERVVKEQYVQKPKASHRRRVRPKVLPATSESVSDTPVEEMEPLRLEDGKHITTLTIRKGMCQFSFGEPSDATFAFCGRAIARGSFCAGHAKTMYQPRQTRKESKPPKEVDELRRLERLNRW